MKLVLHRKNLGEHDWIKLEDGVVTASDPELVEMLRWRAENLPDEYISVHGLSGGGFRREAMTNPIVFWQEVKEFFLITEIEDPDGLLQPEEEPEPTDPRIRKFLRDTIG